MFWSIFLQSLFLILAIVIAGRFIAAMLSKSAGGKNNGSA